MPFVVSQADMVTFSKLSGDSSPVHMDHDFARQSGFDGPVVFGALIVAKISKLLGMHLPGPGGVWTGLTIEFRKPLYVDEKASIYGEVDHASAATGMLSLRLKVTAGNRLIAKASAESVLTSGAHKS